MLRHNKLVRTGSTTLSLGLFLITMLILSCLSIGFFNLQKNQILAQPYVSTIKYRNLAIDLGNGLKTNAQLTYPAIGKGPFPGVLLIAGSGALDKNGTAGPKTSPDWQIAQHLSERGFAVLRYDKRGVGENHLDTNVWGNATGNDAIHDAEKALNVLVQQPEVDPKRISIISEGTLYAPRIAIDNSTKVKNIILMGTVAQNFGDIVFYRYVNLLLRYAAQVLDKNHTGSISIQQISKDPFRYSALLTNLLPSSILLTFSRTHDTKVISNALVNEFGNNAIQVSHVSIDKQLKPLLIKKYENLTASNPSKCNNVLGCPIWMRSMLRLIPTLSIIGNVSKSTGIL